MLEMIIFFFLKGFVWQLISKIQSTSESLFSQTKDI